MTRARTTARVEFAPGDLVVFDWHSHYLAEGLVSKGGDASPEWVEIVPGDPGIVITVEHHYDKPYVVLLGRQNRLVKLSATMIKKTPSKSPSLLLDT